MIDESQSEAPKKKSGLVVTIAAIAAVTIVGGAGGWIVGKMLAPAVEPPKVEAKAEEKPAEGAKDKEAGLPRVATEANGIVQLEPITTNLAFPTDRWIRLEVALMFEDAPDPKLAETIHQDIAVYIRTVSLQQIEGPRGFQYLKEDLEERADLISEGKVSRIMFRTFVIQ